jgi:hypothetical protein
MSLAAASLSLACDRIAGMVPGEDPPEGSPRLEDSALPGEPVSPGLDGAVIEIAGDRVHLRARQAPRVRLLKRLGEQAGFQVVAAPIEPKQISTDLVAVSLADAVGALLSDVPHALVYEPDSAAGTPRLAVVRVGDREGLTRRAGRSREARTRFRQQMGIGRPDSELTREQRERRERMAQLRERRKEAAERNAERRTERRKVQRPDPPEPPENPEELLEDRDPEVRSRAVSWIEPQGEGSARLQTLLAEDPDPGVRAAAAYRLVGADSIGAARSLIAALDDPDSEVVLAAIDTLEYSHDPSLIPDLEPLLGHPDPEVREAAAEAIDFLR